MQEMDVFLPIGPNCRSVSYLRNYGLTRFASPSDWFVFRNLDTILQLYQNLFFDFFLAIEEFESRPGQNGFRFVRDTRYNVKSIHHFEKKLSLAAGQAYVRNRTVLRAQKTDQALKDANSVGLVGNWTVPRDELADFLRGFSEIYPGKKIVLYNIHHVPDETRHWKTETSLSSNLSIEEFFFCDEGEKDSPDFWLGNKFYWKKIVEQFRLSPESQKRRDEACRKP